MKQNRSADIKVQPNNVDALHFLGILFCQLGHLDSSVKYIKKALQLNPTSASAHNNLGIALKERGELDEAITCYRKALELNPHLVDAHFNMSLALLLSGNFVEGWKEFDWRRKIKSISFQRDFSQPLWNGSEIAGLTILLCAEYGFGDTIQFVRYAPLVAQHGARVIVECPKELASLIKNCEGAHQVIAYGEQLPEFDIYSPLLRLPLVFQTTLETIPAKLAYISVDPMLVEKWRDKFSHDNSKLKIGLALAGRARYGTLRHRSCSFEMFSALSSLDNTTFYSQQKGEAAKEAKHPPTGMKFFDYTQEINDFSDTAALMENLDLIISVDTAVAHLAGALGKPVWTLVPFTADWRWLLDREDSPWYPMMRLFRQPPHGGWETVISRVLDHVQRKISASQP